MGPLRRAVVVVALVAWISILAAPAASAKTLFDHVTVTGPGSAAVRIAGDSQDSSVLMDVSGYTPLAYEPTSRKVLDSAPSTTDLGQRYEVTYVRPAVILPDTRDERVSITQFLFPFADPEPLACMPARQRGTAGSGGWFVADNGLPRELQRLGVLRRPAETTSTGTDDVVAGPRPIATALAATVLAAVLAALCVITIRARAAR
jgi:hypothetical protein